MVAVNTDDDCSGCRMQIKILSQRADAYNFDGRLLEAISDAKSAVQAIKQHLLTIKLAQEKTGLQFEATAPAPAVEGTIPVCILGDAVSSQIHTQLSLLLIQSCDFAALRAVLAGLVCSNAEQTSNAKQLVLEALEAEVIHVIEAAEELASANEPLEAVRSYTIALDGIATMEVHEL